MAIIIGADGGKLGGPLKALEAAGEALATNYQLQAQARQEERQNRLDTASLAEQQQIMRLRNTDELRRQREMTLKEAESKRQEADAEWRAKQRAIADNERVAAKTGAASRLKALLGGDHADDPSFMGPDSTTDEQRAVRLGIPVETLREYDVLASQAPNLSPDEYQQAAQEIAQRAQGLIYSRRKANVLGLLGTLSSPSMSADGQEGTPIIDKKRAQELQEALERGASPDEVERVLSTTLKSHAQRQAASQVNTIRTQGLAQYLMDIQAAGDNAQMAGGSSVDPEDLTDALAIQKQMEAIASLATPSEIAAMDREARRLISGGRDRGSGSGKHEKPRNLWDAHDWYDRDIANAKSLGYSGQAAEDYIARAEKWRAEHGASSVPSGVAGAQVPMGGGAPTQYTVDPNAPMPQQAPAAPIAPAQNPLAGAAGSASDLAPGTDFASLQRKAGGDASGVARVDPFTKTGTPEERVAAAASELIAMRTAGDMLTTDEIRAFLLAAKNGEPRPERTTDRRGKPLTKGTKRPLLQGADSADTQGEVDRLNQMLDR